MFNEMALNTVLDKSFTSVQLPQNLQRCMYGCRKNFCREHNQSKFAKSREYFFPKIFSKLLQNFRPDQLTKNCFDLLLSRIRLNEAKLV